MKKGSTGSKKIGWREAEGPGEFNYRSRGIGFGIGGGDRGGIPQHPMVSVDLDDAPDGSTIVSFWMSQWRTHLGIASACDRVISKRWMLRRHLNALGRVEVIPS